MDNIENYKDIELSGRKWRIKKFDARTGSYILFKVLGLFTPVLKSLDIKSIKEIKDENINLTEIAANMMSLEEKDFKYIQDKCLQVCYEILPGGPAPVLNDSGNYGVIGIENDIATVLGLTAHALVFNISGFFAASHSTLLGGIISNISRQDSKT